jgi:hypothetical protein
VFRRLGGIRGAIVGGTQALPQLPPRIDNLTNVVRNSLNLSSPLFYTISSRVSANNNSP